MTTVFEKQFRESINWKRLQEEFAFSTTDTRIEGFKFDIVQYYYLKTFIKLVSGGHFEDAFQVALKTMKLKFLSDFHQMIVGTPLVSVVHAQEKAV